MVYDSVAPPAGGYPVQLALVGGSDLLAIRTAAPRAVQRGYAHANTVASKSPRLRQGLPPMTSVALLSTSTLCIPEGPQSSTVVGWPGRRALSGHGRHW